MKKVIYIFIIGLGLIATSCQKQDITPNNERTMELPRWSNENDNNARFGEASEDDKEDDFDENENGIEITDPNKPSEGSGGRDGKGKN